MTIKLTYYIIKIMNINNTFTNTITVNNTNIQHNFTEVDQDGLLISFHTYEDNNIILNVIETDNNNSNFIIEPIVEDPNIEIIETLDNQGLVQFDIAVRPQAQQDTIITYLNSIAWVNIISNQHIYYEEEK